MNLKPKPYDVKCKCIECGELSTQKCSKQLRGVSSIICDDCGNTKPLRGAIK